MSKRPIAVLALAAAVLVLGTACMDTKSKIQSMGGVPLEEGTARVDVNGATETGFDATLDRAQVGQVDTVFVYKNESKDLFSITGLGIDGTAKTSNTLVLVVTKDTLIATSTKGECAIRVSHDDGGAVSGSATCTHLDSSQGNINLKATFSASP
ncbi:MAG TPA: hypothetical protein VID47_10760 [Actinomycetota bacterium]